MVDIQKKNFLNSIKSFDELTTEQKEKAFILRKSRIIQDIQEENIDFFEDNEDPVLALLYEPVKSAWEISEANGTPWFFIETLLERKTKEGEYVGDLIDRFVKQEIASEFYSSEAFLLNYIGSSNGTNSPEF